MEQAERIRKMEQNLDKASAATMELSAALDKYLDAQTTIKELSDYYDAGEWKQDFADDEAGLLPHDLKRGVLSEDGIWNLLSDCRDLNARLQEMVDQLQPQQGR